ncbi:E3 ubiquitin-protein ligase RNF126-like isoform X2 [Artemia franciscana]|uniref:RING-type E3 ubiquitin transferase n=1 Tax=Artemia franciscana TaxID=6661 RepID=A0AA88L214_ARTSF|nr:hypothetical protein QYM36_009517 [Artemia franciscana]
MDEPSTEHRRYYCHQCERQIEGNLQDFKCPTCLSGFVEQLEENIPHVDFDEPVYLGIFDNGSSGSDRQEGSRRRRHMATHQIRSIRRRGPGQQASPMEQIIQEFVNNLTGGMNLENLDEEGAGPMFLVGNPGDYAWGLGGLDTIITQLLNQVEGMGPPPMSKEKIKDLETVEITERQVSESLQCSVCWEDYKLGESVRKLPCEHLFHNDCIVPWLELHGTCPVCRKSFVEEGESRGSDGPSTSSSSSSSTEAGSSRGSNNGESLWSRRSSNAGGFLQSLFGSLSNLTSGRGSQSSNNQSNPNQPSSESASQSRESPENRRVTRSQTRSRQDDQLDLD